MRYDSPLRYPGGKASLAPFLARAIATNDLLGCQYFEPFAGGAGAALGLLRRRVVSELRLNDLDYRIVAFWQAVLTEPAEFVDRIHSVPLTIQEWRNQEQVYSKAATAKDFDLGFAVFYLNRCNRSGLLRGAGPIGGHAQSGKWALDARFNRDALARRVLAVARRRDRIRVENMDARAFLVRHLPRGRGRSRVFAYLDPPYYANGRRLYLNAFDDADHKALAAYLKRQRSLRWLMSYDDTPFIRKLYGPCVVSGLALQYSLQRKSRAQELLLAPSYVQLPPAPDDRAGTQESDSCSKETLC